jgi:predicted histidine transporter YuiF (NhaC family)
MTESTNLIRKIAAIQPVGWSAMLGGFGVTRSDSSYYPTSGLGSTSHDDHDAAGGDI